MSRLVAISLDVAAALAGVTGLVYGWMRYVCEPADEWAVVNHPLEPATQAWHLVVAPLLVFTVGAIWLTHVWPRIRARHPARRASGLVLATLFVPMVATGYLLQTSVDESWRTAWIWTHATTSIGWLASYVVHRVPTRTE